MPVSRRVAYVLLASLVLVWGAHWPIMKLALGQIPPFTYAALRMASALPVVLVVLAVRHELRLPPRADLGVLLVIGLGQVGASIILVNLALQAVAPGRSSILAYTTPFWAAVIQAVVLGVAVRRREVAGIAVGLAGIAVLLNPAVLDWGNGGQLAGSLGLVASAAVTALSVIVVRRHTWHSTPLQLLPWQLLVALAPIAMLALALEGATALHPTPAMGLFILYSGPLATAYGYWCSQIVSRSLSPTVTTMGMLATPVVGLVASSILVGERLSALDLLGFAATVVGIGIVAMGSGRPRAVSRP